MRVDGTAVGWTSSLLCMGVDGTAGRWMPSVRTSNNTAVLLTVTGQSVASSGSEEPSRVPVV